MAQEEMSTKLSTPSTTNFTWVINNFTKSNTKKLLSDVFIALGYNWRLYLDPKGNNGNVLWVYLEVVDSAKLPSHWSINVEISLTLVNQFLKEDSIKKYGKCKFCAGQIDWGCPYFMILRDLSKGYIVNDTVIIELDVSVGSSLQDSKREIDAKRIPVLRLWTPASAPSAISVASSSTSSRSRSSTLLAMEKSKNLLAELSTITTESIASNGILDSSLVPSLEDTEQQRKALKDYFSLSLEDIDQANAFNDVKQITTLLLQHSVNSLERKILTDLLSCLAAFKEIVLAIKSSIDNMRAEKESLLEKKKDVWARLYQGQEQLSSLEVKFSKVLQEERELEVQTHLQLLITKNSVALELEKINEQVSKDLEEWRDINKESEQPENDWIQAREKLAQANLSWKLFKRNFELNEKTVLIRVAYELFPELM